MYCKIGKHYTLVSKINYNNFFGFNFQKNFLFNSELTFSFIEKSFLKSPTPLVYACPNKGTILVLE